MKLPKMLRKKSKIEQEEADRRKMETILQRKDELPIPLRPIIDKIDQTAKPKAFLIRVEFELYKFISGLKGSLDDERDTICQVELAVRFFPNVLSRRDLLMSFPIFSLFRSIKSVSFVPLFARLGLEFGVFRSCERGGFVLGSFSNAFFRLGGSCNDVSPDDVSGQGQMDQRLLEIIQELRRQNFMTESDIVNHFMMQALCQQKHFPEKRFLYLVNWNPRALLMGKRNNDILYDLIQRFLRRDDTKSLEGAKMLFGVLIRYYPLDLGFLFDKTIDGDSISAFELACREFGREPILSILNDAVNSQMRLEPDFTQKALVRMGSRDTDSLDAVFFLMQNNPMVVCRHLDSLALLTG